MKVIDDEIVAALTPYLGNLTNNIYKGLAPVNVASLYAVWGKNPFAVEQDLSGNTLPFIVPVEFTVWSSIENKSQADDILDVIACGVFDYTSDAVEYVNYGGGSDKSDPEFASVGSSALFNFHFAGLSFSVT